MCKMPSFSIPSECISLDIVGPYRPGAGRKMYILTSICRASGWTDCFPLAIISAEQIGKCLIGLFSRQGLPREILSDRGRQFVDKL